MTSCCLAPSQHLSSLHPTVFWMSDINQMEENLQSIETIVVQQCVGRDYQNSFTLSNLSNLTSLVIGKSAFECCQSIVFDSMND